MHYERKLIKKKCHTFSLRLSFKNLGAIGEFFKRKCFCSLSSYSSSELDIDSRQFENGNGPWVTDAISLGKCPSSFIIISQLFSGLIKCIVKENNDCPGLPIWHHASSHK